MNSEPFNHLSRITALNEQKHIDSHAWAHAWTLNAIKTEQKLHGSNYWRQRKESMKVQLEEWRRSFFTANNSTFSKEHTSKSSAKIYSLGLIKEIFFLTLENDIFLLTFLLTFKYSLYTSNNIWTMRMRRFHWQGVSKNWCEFILYSEECTFSSHIFCKMHFGHLIRHKYNRW